MLLLRQWSLLGCGRVSRHPTAMASALPRLSRGSSGGVVLSDQRLNEFVTAEISYFAQRTPQPVKLAQIFQASTPALAAALIHAQLPKDFATRIKHIEALPHWDAVPKLLEVHQILTTSFRKLRLLPQGSDLEPLGEVIKDLRQRHKPILPWLSAGMTDLRAEDVVEEAFVDKWLGDFLLARIGTEMLTMHFLKLSSGSCTGIVDRCDPGKVCREAVAAVSADPKYAGVPMHVESNASERGMGFQFMPIYLKMLVTEILKNSASAAVRKASAASTSSAGTPASAAPVSVFVGANDYQVMIEISDKGGGIPMHYKDKIWSHSGHLSAHVADESMPFSWTDPLENLGIKQRLGMGLPLTRLYTQYLGGSLELMSIPGVGVDTFINLQRVDPKSLPLPSAP